MQWDKKEAVSTSGESQTRLGRWATLRTLEPSNNTQCSYQETPFFLVHGAEAVLPVEITHEAPRIVAYDETTSTEALQDGIDSLDEARDVALARATQYQQNLRNYHSSRVRPRSFVVGDLVLWLKQDGHGKLESPWVGPYIVTEVIPGGSYRL
jgi:hypothetical protein